MNKSWLYPPLASKDFNKFVTRPKEEIKNSFFLSQKDCHNGTIRITMPGTYVLTENLVFHFNKNNNFKPTEKQTLGPEAEYPLAPHGAYNLGFFAGITIECDNVTLDLNGYEISQSLEFSLNQRFFALVELASSPFIPKQGPSNFGSEISIPNNVTIKNGVFGKNSHHGIHGNLMKNVLLTNLTFKDFEVAAVALNGGENIIIKNCLVINNCKNIKLLSTFSQSLFALPHLERIEKRDPSSFLRVDGKKLTATMLLHSLNKEIEMARNYVLNDAPYDGIFKNKSKLYDGNVYGIVLNSKGVVIGDFRKLRTKNTVGNKNITLENISINNLSTDSTEIIGINCDSNTTDDEVKAYGKDQFVGPVGDVVDIELITNPDGTYKENIYSNVQFFIGKNAQTKKEKGTSNLTDEIVCWVEKNLNIHNYLRENKEDDNKTKCNYKIKDRDSMGHIMKGNMGIFISQGDNVSINNSVVNNVNNNGKRGKAADSCGILVCGSNNVKIKNNECFNIISKNGKSENIGERTTNENILIR